MAQTEFVITLTDALPKKEVSVKVDGIPKFSATIKVNPEQILDNLTVFLLRKIRDDIEIQEDTERNELGIWRK